ncbi:transposase [Streptomyces sp. NPDC050625]|uniref:transposase n=1 Tax=Streptomyces sp. NPDC050625 TaxID=3154629 RepID=UPI003421B0BF
MIRRHELTDGEWELLARLIPRAVTGRPRLEDRKIINGLVYKIRTGISWRELPARYGPWKTALRSHGTLAAARGRLSAAAGDSGHGHLPHAPAHRLTARNTKRAQPASGPDPGRSVRSCRRC